MACITPAWSSGGHALKCLRKPDDPEINEVADAFGTLSGIILNVYLAVLGS